MIVIITLVVIGSTNLNNNETSVNNKTNEEYAIEDVKKIINEQ